MVKRIFKILGISIGIFVAILGVGFGIYALQGGFKEVEINIVRLYVDDATKADKTIYTLEDFTTCINYEPLDATSTDLEVEIQDPLRIVEDGVLIQEGVLKNVPSVVKAGEDFKIQINKDARGNNYGGAVTLTFTPKDHKKLITDFKLKVIVDVAIPNKSLYFAGNNGDSYSTVDGKTITMGINNEEQFIYLKSNLVNAFCLEADNKNLKNAYISYTYITLDGKRCYNASTGKFIEKDKGIWTTADAIKNEFDGLKYNRVSNEIEKQYNYFFEVPVTPSQSGTIVMTAQMHKTYEIEQDYIAGGFDSFDNPSLLSGQAKQAALEKIQKYNEFINKYIKYFDTTNESYEFFSNSRRMNSSAIVTIPYGEIETSKKFVFETTTATINVSAVNLDSISSTAEKDFKVLSSQTYTIQNMIDAFDLSIKLSKDNVAHIDTEKANLFSKLQVSPYIYLDKDEYLNTKDTLWQNYYMVRGVVDFTDNGKPVVSSDEVTSENVTSDEWKGFLILLSPKNSYDEYITISTGNDSQNPVWTINFNTPLKRSNTGNSISTASKALFLEFQVEGQDLKTNEKIIRYDFTRVYIDYTDYIYNDPTNAKLVFTNSLQDMSITNEVNNAAGSNYASELNEQSISISLENSISNYGEIQYKNVMFFVESKSNMVDTEGNGGKKLATLGKYNFRYLTDGISGADNMVKYFDTTENLIGERLIGTRSDTAYKLYALNASEEPARIFAVVYLSDRLGNPIDVNGRPITINESGDDSNEETTLVVFAITDITQSGMASVKIDNFVNNLNYYTISQIDHTISQDFYDGENVIDTLTYTIHKDEWVKRNKVDSYGDIEKDLYFGEDQLTGENKLTELQNFLKLKILYNNQISLYVTNFDLTTDGQISEKDTETATYTMSFDPFSSKNTKNEQDKKIVKSYVINTLQNKRLALNKMLTDFDNQYFLNIVATNSTPIQKTEIIYEDEEETVMLAIRFDIVAEGKMNSTDDYIYIKAKSGVPNALSNTSDYVGWEVNKLEIEDVILYDDREGDNLGDYTYNKLYANYSDSPDGGQVFGNVKYGTGGFRFSSYYLYNKEDRPVQKGSIDDNISYWVMPNLVSEYGDINLSLVDMSQAVYTIAGTTTSTSTKFDCIYDYIKYYVSNTNTIDINYENADGMAQLLQDLYFPSENGYICVGDKEYYIQTGGVQIDGINYNKYIEANNRKYGVSRCTDTSDFYYNKDVVCIKSGEYFPIISNGGVHKVIICDEEFEIKDDENVSEENAGIIYNISSTASTNRRSVIIRKSTIINGSAYDVKNYIDEGIKDGTKSALKKTEDTTDKDLIANATVKFLKGGVLKDENGNDIYVKDENGKYCFNANTNSYDICPDGTPVELRYSKKGIMAYLLVTFNFKSLSSGNTTITKVFAYELVQEPVTLVATGLVGNNNGTVVLKPQAENTNRITINAGSNTSFALSNISSANTIINRNTISIVGASYETSFFKHCTFTVEEGNSGIKFVKNGSLYTSITIGSLNENIVLNVPDRYSTTDANIMISYKDDNGLTVTKYLRLTIKPNYSFQTKDNVQDLTIEDDKYVISLASNTTYGITDLISTYFNVGDDCTIKLVNVDTLDKYASISGDNLTIGDSYGYIQDNVVHIDEAEFIIKLVKGANELEINNHLKVRIVPQYIVDLNKISGNILYGTKVISSDYITIYENITIENGKVMYKDHVVSENSFDSVATDIGLNLYDVNNNLLSDGKVISSNKYSTLDAITFKIKYSEGLTAEEEFTKTITVVGFEVYYSQSGELADNEAYSGIASKAVALPSTLSNTYLLKAGEKLNATDYFRVFTVNNSLSKNIYPVFIQGNNVLGTSLQDNYGTYHLGYAILNNSTFELLAVDNNMQITTKKLELFYSSAGFGSDITYNTLKNNASYNLNNNIEIQTTSSTFDYANYFKFYADGVAIDVIIKDGSNTIGNSEATIEEGKVYTICCSLNGTTYDTGYTLTVKKINE